MTNVVLTCYLNSVGDDQRGGECWPADPQAVAPLIQSIVGGHPVLLTDCLSPTDFPNIRVEQIHCPTSPYLWRWKAEYLWLLNHPEVEQVWCVDATDVRMLNTPWDAMVEGALYCCVEEDRWTIGNNPWFAEHSSTIPTGWIAAFADHPCLNCGVVGGDREAMLWLLSQMDAQLTAAAPEDPVEESAWFNVLAYQHPGLTFGRQVTTPYRSYVRTDPMSWFAHK